MTGQLWIIAAPSGAGKTSLVDALIATTPDLYVSISHTTRAPRPAEEEGKNYFFVRQDVFESMIQRHAFIEYAKVFDHYYGTEQSWVQKQLAEGMDVILEIDWQGAQQIKRLMPDTKSIFILPPSLATLSQRLEGRGQDKPEVISRRLKEATLEMSHCEEFDYIVINDQFEQALAELSAIITAQRLSTSRQVQKYGTLLQDLRE
jgi:guanylate kinase